MSDSKYESIPVAVYVHLGPNLPKHLRLSLSRHIELFPHQELVLITSHNQHFDIPITITQFKVNTDVLESELFREMSKELDFEFRDGFWKYTLQRFFAIGEFHKLNPTKALTHIESDVLLMPNFPWEKFANLKRLAWLKVNSSVDVAAIVHFPSSDKTQVLLKEIARLARLHPNTNDMVVLHESAKNLKSHHQYLPSLSPNNVSERTNLSAEQRASLEEFGGIFDPLNLGLWYFGQDPKNSFGLRKRYVGDKSHDINPIDTAMKYESRVLSDSNGTVIYSLHIHAKYLPLFGPKWESAIKISLKEAQNREKGTSFDIAALFLSLRGRRARQNLWLLIANIPGINNLRKFETLELLKNKMKRSFHI